jgi:hypothetical protein
MVSPERSAQARGRPEPACDKQVHVLLVGADREEALRVQKMLAAVSRPRFDLECADRLSSALGRLAAGDIDTVMYAEKRSKRMVEQNERRDPD